MANGTNIFRFVITKVNPLPNETLICIHERGIITEPESVEIRNKIILLNKQTKKHSNDAAWQRNATSPWTKQLEDKKLTVFQSETISVSGYCLQPLINQIKSKNIGGGVWNTF